MRYRITRNVGTCLLVDGKQMTNNISRSKRPRHALIDLVSLRQLRHKCNLCARRSAGSCCCGRFEVCITRSELRKIVGIIPYIANYCRHLQTNGESLNVFDETEDGLYSIDIQSNGLCAFAYRHKGKILCGIHSAAESLGINWHEAKPLSCLLWPLAISDGPLNVISIDESAMCFHCNSRKSTGSEGIDLSVLQILRRVVGNYGASQIEKAAINGLQRTRIPLRGLLKEELTR